MFERMLSTKKKCYFCRHFKNEIIILYMDFTGKIIAVLPEKTGVSAKGEWKVQEFVIEDSASSQYPRRMCFSVFGADKLAQFNIQVGQDLTVSFDIDAREYQGRWFNSIRAWRVAPAVQAAPGVMPAAAYGAEVPPVAPVASAPAASAAAPLASDESSDLPF